jgi:Trk K+ transport system NAD-binding subunit
MHHPPVEVGAIPALGGDIFEFVVGDDDLDGRQIRDLGLPADATVMVIVRDGSGVAPRGDTRLERDDHVYVLVTGDARDHVEELLGGSQSSSL